MSRAANSPAPADIEATASDWTVRRDAGLTPPEAAEFERWKAADPRHREAVARHDRVWAVLDRPRQGGQADALMRKFEAHAARRRRQVQTAAVLVLLLAAGAYWRFRAVPRAEPAPSGALVVMPERRTLPDGSIVELKTGAAITVEYSPGLRRVSLDRGEAHFQVARNRDVPFIVAAGGVDFRAVGTAFSVQLGARQVELLVTEGRVAVDQPISPASSPGAVPAGPAAAAQTIATVNAGNRLVVSLPEEKGRPVPVETAAPPEEMAERLAWRAPRLEFTDTSLADAVALMNRHNRVQLVLGDPSLAGVRVTGLFRADNTDAFVRLLRASFGIEAGRAGDTITLRRAR